MVMSAINIIKSILLFSVIIADIVYLGYSFYTEIKLWLQSRKNKKINFNAKQEGK